MSILQFQGKKIFYRSVGEGKPLLILNGIMMSTKSWLPFEKAFTKHNTNLILLDLLDQGESEAMDFAYDQRLQAELVKFLLDELRIDKITIMGTSYGGEVALQFATMYQERVERLILANTVPKTNTWLKEIGNAWILAGDNPTAYYSTTIPVIYSPEFYERKAEWMNRRKQVLIDTVFSSKEFIDRMSRLTISAENHDVTEKLQGITVPTLIIGSEQDHITPLEEQRKMAELMPIAELVILPNTGHASFYEKPTLFTSFVMGFLHADWIEL